MDWFNPLHEVRIDPDSKSCIQISQTFLFFKSQVLFAFFLQVTIETVMLSTP